MPRFWQEIELDPAIRNWVLLPLSFIMLASGLLRHYLAVLMHSKPAPQSLAAIRESRALQRGPLLRRNGNNLPPEDFAAIRDHLTEAYDKGSYVKPAAPSSSVSDDPSNMLNPEGLDGMMGMFKQQLVNFLPQTLLMYYINSAYSGFLLTRLPFRLTNGFKPMLQRGVYTNELDPSWVSSLSWYILCLFGLNPIYRLIIGDNAQSELTTQMAMPMQMPTFPGQPAQNFAKLFKVEKENLDIMEYKWVCDGVEDRFLAKFQ